MYSIVFQCLTIAGVASLAEVLVRDAVRKKTCMSGLDDRSSDEGSGPRSLSSRPCTKDNRGRNSIISER